MKVKYVILIVLSVIIATFFYGRYLGQQKGDSASNALINAKDNEIQRYITRIGNDSVYIAQKEQELKSQREAIKDGDISREELRKLNIKQVNEISRLKLRIDTLLTDVSHNGQIIHIVSDTVSVLPKDAILLPFSFKKTDKWLNLSGTFNSQGKLDISLKKDLFLDVWSGIEKKTKLPKVTISTNDPYIGVIDIKSAKFDFPKDKRYGMGLQAGCGITTQFKPSPYIGIGISYNFIRF